MPKSKSDCRITEKVVKLLDKDILTTVLEVAREQKKGVNLCDATVIVAGGRGVGSKDGMECLFSLAEVIGGEVAGTRMVIEEGWLPVERQVGQTGQTVRPELYIACGISGAIQHRAGMLNSRYVIAVNKDERAPIFQVADWGIVGDLHEEPLVPGELLNRSQCDLFPGNGDGAFLRPIDKCLHLVDSGDHMITFRDW